MTTAPNTNENTVDEEKGAPLDPDARVAEAQSLVKNNVIWAMGVGVVPFPLIDLLGISGVQIKMLREMSSLYDIPFSEHKVKNIVGALIAGLGSIGIGGAVAFSVFKVVPLMGHLAGALAVPAAAGALTYAVGTVFIQHFESGGTILDFDPKAVREHFRAEFEKAKDVARDLQAEHQSQKDSGQKVSGQKDSGQKDSGQKDSGKTTSN